MKEATFSDEEIEVAERERDDIFTTIGGLEAEVGALSDQLGQSFDYIVELESQQPYLSWIERACWLLVGFTAAMLLVLLS